jgi:uncharacterized protein
MTQTVEKKLIEEPKYIEEISTILNLSLTQIKNILLLREEGATVPFIARYRKEMTQNLDEDEIRLILSTKQSLENLYKTKKTILNAIDAQDKLTAELHSLIFSTSTLKELEDIYAPFKRAKKTKADLAREKGFEVIATMIKHQEKILIPATLSSKYSQEEILEGAKNIVSQDIVDDVKYKDLLRNYFNDFGEIESKHTTAKKLEELPEPTKKQLHKFDLYKTFSSEVVRIKEYQVLALNRGEDLGILSINLSKDLNALKRLKKKVIKLEINFTLLEECVEIAYKKLFKSIETEIRNEITQRAHVKAIESFSDNLYKLLMTKPQYGKKVLAIDPGFRTGCKIAILDEQGKPIHFDKIFTHQENNAKQIIKNLLGKYTIDIIVIGNGTGSNETYDLLSEVTELPFVIVNESGASVYSASEVAKKEFPELDLTDRGTISIGRRFIDPLSELVKVPVESIGVGMYQHDINQKQLREELEITISKVVNKVGINVNTASVFVLKFISGLTQKSAQKLVDNVPYKSRKEIKKILTPKSYEQAIGFLRVNDSKEELDKTAIHPEQYEITKHIIENKIEKYSDSLKEIYGRIEIHTFEFIKQSLTLTGQDLRIYDAVLKIKKTHTLDDLQVDDVIEGVVRNIMQFGVFVDIGVKNDGLVHISELADKFVKDPNEIVSIGQEVKVKILSIHKEKGKINLSMKGA